jgi:hypothetical protein
MKRTKRDYHYAVRKLKREQDLFSKCRMAESIAINKSRQFWAEVKKVNKTSSVYPVNIENKSNPGDIASHFANKYKDLYNSVPSDLTRIENIKEKVNSSCCYNQFTNMEIQMSDIKKGVNKLKSDKADGTGDFYSNHILYASESFLCTICKLYNAMLIHGYSPQDLLNSTLISIPKDVRGDLSSDENYRGISLCSSLFKLYEIILLNKQSLNLTTSDMQFAYKNGHSTTMATLILKDVVNHFMNSKSDVYCCFIDASKAFDKIRHDLLFEILLERKVNPLMIRSLIDSYERQTISTKWLNTLSEQFQCSNGVRQGGILSPYLYAVYNDILLNRLKEHGIGCWIGNSYYGALSYADDLCIICPTVKGLQEMLNVCEKYGSEFDVSFNPKKTKCMKFTKIHVDNTEINIELCGKKLSWVSSFKYLGNWITYNLSEEVEIKKKLGQFYGDVNYLNATFKHADYKSLSSLFNAHCCHYYGSQAWCLDNVYIGMIYTAWNKAVRHLFKLPYNTHTKFLQYVVNTLTVKTQILLRTMKMLSLMYKSENQIVNFLVRHNIHKQTSIIAKNIRIAKTAMDLETIHENARFKMHKKMYESVDSDIIVLCELLNVRQGHLDINCFDVDEVEELILHVCTN